MPEVAFYIEGIQIAKRGIAMDIQKFIPDLAETKFVEAFKAEPKPAPAAPAPAATTPEPTPAPEPETKAAADLKKLLKPIPFFKLSFFSIA